MTFDEFLHTELAGLRAYAAVLTGDTQQAHDILADALVGAYARWQRISAMDFPTAYVRRMVTSRFFSERRRWSVRMIRPTRSGRLPDITVEDPTRTVDDRAQLSELLAKLPARPRAVLVLRYFLGLSNAEIAAELRITPGAVRTAVSRGLAALRIAANDDGAGEAGADDADDRTAHDDGAAPAPGPSASAVPPLEFSHRRPRTEEGS